MGKFFYFFIKHRNNVLFGGIFTSLLKLLGLELPAKTKIGKNITFPHLGGSIVIHPFTEIGDNVQIYHDVTIGRADVYNSWENSEMEKIVIENGAILCPGSKILCKKGTLTVGENTIIGANSVLQQSTGKNEIWAGIPAKKVGIRKDLSEKSDETMW